MSKFVSHPDPGDLIVARHNFNLSTRRDCFRPVSSRRLNVKKGSIIQVVCNLYKDPQSEYGHLHPDGERSGENFIGVLYNGQLFWTSPSSSFEVMKNSQ